MKHYKKYTCVVKAGPERFLRYRINNLVQFTAFLDRQWTDWRWFNVFENRSGVQVANFTKYNKPSQSHIQ